VQRAVGGLPPVAVLLFTRLAGIFLPVFLIFRRNRQTTGWLQEKYRLACHNN